MGTDATDSTGTADSTGNERALEDGIVTDLSGRMTYGSYLGLDQLLNGAASGQRLRSTTTRCSSSSSIRPPNCG